MFGRMHGAAAALLLLPVALLAQGSSSANLARDLERLRTREGIAGVPPTDSVSQGARTIPAGSVVRSTVVATGPIDVFGRVDGSVVSLNGNVIVHRGGVVNGDALSIGGRVDADSGSVTGEMRSMSSLPAAVSAAVLAVDRRTPAQRTFDALRIAIGTFGIALIIAVGVVLFASPNLDEVVSTMQAQFARAFWFGVLGQLALLPALLVLIIALTLTVIGILLIPFAVVAYGVAAAGLLTLGFMATARVVGSAVRSRADATPRARSLVALAMGITIFFVLWAIAAALSWAPLAASVVRAAALAATWAAFTLGMGAALISRAGTHRRLAAGVRPLELASWQTPTPVTGVVAARRTAGSRDAR